MKKFISILLVYSILFVAVGCQHNVNTSPRVVFANTILAGAEAVDTVSVGLVAADRLIIKLKPAEPEYYAQIHPRLVKIAQANDRAVAVLKAAEAGDAAADWRAALNEVAIAAAGTDPAVFGFKNPNSQAAVKIGLASLQAAIAALSSFNGGK